MRVRTTHQCHDIKAGFACENAHLGKNRLDIDELPLHCDIENAAMQHPVNSGGKNGFFEILQKTG